MHCALTRACLSGVVQKPPRQVEEARTEPADGPVQEQLPAAVQRPHAALRGHVPGLHLQQLDQQGPRARAALHQELHLLQLHEPAHLAVHVLRAQLHLLHDHGLRHGPLRRAWHARPGSEQHQQPERDRNVRHQLGHVVVRLSVRASRLPVQRLPGHVQLQPGDAQTQIQTASHFWIQRPAEPRIQPERLPVQQLTGWNVTPEDANTIKPNWIIAMNETLDHAGYTFTCELTQQFKLNRMSFFYDKDLLHLLHCTYVNVNIYTGLIR